MSLIASRRTISNLDALEIWSAFEPKETTVDLPNKRRGMVRSEMRGNLNRKGSSFIGATEPLISETPRRSLERSEPDVSRFRVDPSELIAKVNARSKRGASKGRGCY